MQSTMNMTGLCQFRASQPMRRRVGRELRGAREGGISRVGQVELVL